MKQADLPNSKLSYIALSDPGESLRELAPEHSGQRVIAFGINRHADWKSYDGRGEQGDAQRLMDALKENFGVNEYRSRPARELSASVSEIYVTQIPNDLVATGNFLGNLYLKGLIAEDDLPGVIRQLSLPLPSLDNERATHARLPERDDEPELAGGHTYHI